MVTTSVRPPAQQFGPVPRRFWAPGLDLFDVLGQIVLFSVAALRSIPRALRYRHEIWWYAAFLALGSTPVALVMTYFSGSECSVEAYYSLHQLGGAESLAGVFNALCDMREITPLFFGFAIGAKVICVGVYYGYHVKGGAVGIGRAVAKTMAISLVMIVVVNALLTQIFWGTNPNLPIPS